MRCCLASLKSNSPKSLVPRAFCAFVLVLCTGCLPPAATHPSPLPPRIARVGFLSPSTPDYAPSRDALLQGLEEFGYVEGKNLSLLSRFTSGREELLPELAADLAQQDLDVIVALGVTRVQALREATDRTPIVMALVADPVRSGLVKSLAHPGGNVTGVTTALAQSHGKRLQLFKETVPTMSRVAILWNVERQPLQFQEVEEAGKLLDLDLSLVPVRDEGSKEATDAGIARALDTAIAEGVDGVFLLSDGLFDSRTRELAEMIGARRLPAAYSRADFVEFGGLMAYGVDPQENFRRAAEYVDKLIKGARPEDLPIEQPSRYYFALNLRTAQALGISLSSSAMEQATQFIE